MGEFVSNVCENKGPDQLSDNCIADQFLSFCYMDNTNTLLHESEISNLISSSVFVQHLCRSWSVTSNTGFRAMRLKYVLFLTSKRSMTASVVVYINFTKPNRLVFDI